MKYKRLLILLVLAIGYTFIQGPPAFVKKSVAKELAAHAQPWMYEQVREDLAPFSTQKITSNAIAKLMRLSAPSEGLVHITIKGGRCTFSSDAYFPSSERTRVKHIKKLFNSLARRYRLPDLELVVCVLDACDHRPDLEVPVCVFAKRKDNHRCLLIPDFEAFNPQKRLDRYAHAAIAHPWESKEERVFWRGATTGGIYTFENYPQFPRVKLVATSRDYPQWVDAAFSAVCQSAPEVLDAVLQTTRPLSPYVHIADHFHYKYLIDVDGNSCTYERCRWILLSNSTLLKPDSLNEQWYYKALIPDTHYVPLQADLSDLLPVCQWLKSNDQEARRIAEEGQKLGKNLFSKEAVEEYFLVLLDQYSRIYGSN